MTKDEKPRTCGRAKTSPTFILPMDVRARAATFLSSCPLNSNGLGGDFAPRHLNRWVLSGEIRQVLNIIRLLSAFGDTIGLMEIEETVKIKREEIRRIAERHGATNVRLFGSVARGEAKPESDVDLLVDVEATAQTSSWFPIGLILDLEKLLGRRVEIVTERALNKDLREHVLREAVPL